MKALSFLAAVFMLTFSAFANDEPAKKTANLQISDPNRISVYEVPLVCGAAPQIGCGSRAKPLLTDLEQQSAVAEAWLNRAGTLLAVVWEANANQDVRQQVIKSAAKKINLTMKELKSEARDAAVKDFSSGKGWYRGTAVDRLSEEEVEVIAGRLVRRIKAKVSLSDDKTAALEQAFASVFKQRFFADAAKQEKASRKPIEEELVKAGRAHLDENGVVVLKEAIALGYRPQPNEK